MLLRILMFFLILWLFAIGSIWFAVRQIRSWFSPMRSSARSGAQTQTRHGPSAETNQGKQQKSLAGQLVKCTKCESYIPVEQAILNNSCYYCDPPCNN